MCSWLRNCMQILMNAHSACRIERDTAWWLKSFPASDWWNGASWQTVLSFLIRMCKRTADSCNVSSFIISLSHSSWKAGFISFHFLNRLLPVSFLVSLFQICSVLHLLSGHVLCNIYGNVKHGWGYWLSKTEFRMAFLMAFQISANFNSS